MGEYIRTQFPKYIRTTPKKLLPDKTIKSKVKPSKLILSLCKNIVDYGLLENNTYSYNYMRSIAVTW